MTSTQEDIPLRKAVIMAGGFGTRMKDLVRETPKPMLYLQGKPILEYAIELCKRYGISEILISLHYLPERIIDYFKDGSAWNVNIIYVQEKEPLGTAGALGLAREWLTEPFLMCNADELKDIDLKAMYQQHRSSGAAATIALTEVNDPSSYGVVAIHPQDERRILKFVEKPLPHKAPSRLINAGLYILNPEIIPLIAAGFTMMERDIFPRLAHEGRLFGFPFPGQWFDTGTPQRYVDAMAHWQGFKEKPHYSPLPPLG